MISETCNNFRLLFCFCFFLVFLSLFVCCWFFFFHFECCVSIRSSWKKWIFQCGNYLLVGWLVGWLVGFRCLKRWDIHLKMCRAKRCRLQSIDLNWFRQLFDWKKTNIKEKEEEEEKETSDWSLVVGDAKPPLGVARGALCIGMPCA